MKELAACILAIFVWANLSAQEPRFYKTTSKRNLHYVEASRDFAVVYKINRFYYWDRAGTGPGIVLTDTLLKVPGNQFKGSHYTLIDQSGSFILLTNENTQLTLVNEPDIARVNKELNKAFILKSYVQLSEKLNTEFPLHHFSFRNGYRAWENHTGQDIPNGEFIKRTNQETAFVYDSISKMQHRFVSTLMFVKENCRTADYGILKDSLKTLPAEYSSQSAYFSTSVYEIVNAHPANYYRLVTDFPTAQPIIYSAVSSDKNLVRLLKDVEGFDTQKKEFKKQYNSDKSMLYKIAALYAAVGGLLTWLIVAQP